MNNLIIIGNGFDLAHGLETKYEHFIDDLFERPESKIKTLFQYDLKSSDIGRDFIHTKHRGDRIYTKNSFFDSLLNEYNDKNWCDIERTYFRILADLEGDDTYKLNNNPQKLNEEFDVIKNIWRNT